MSTSADDTDDSLITPVKEDTDQEGSIVSEGTPVPGLLISCCVFYHSLLFAILYF